MKQMYVVLGLLILMLAGGSFYYTNIHKNILQSSSDNDITSQEVLYLYKESGDIVFKNSTSSVFTSLLETKKEITHNATIKTEDGYAFVMFPDNSSIRLSSSTEIHIDYSPMKVSITQLYGSAYYRVSSQTSGTSYVVRTPNTNAVIRGTKFAVLYYPNLTRTLVAVTDHTVEVTPMNEDKKPSEAPVIVQQGSTADVVSSSTLIRTSTTTSQMTAKMIVRNTDEIQELKHILTQNKIIDKEYDITPPSYQGKFIEKIISSQQSEGTSTTTTTSVKEGYQLQPQEKSPSQESSNIVPSSSAEDIKETSSQMKSNDTTWSDAPRKTYQNTSTGKVLQELPVSAELFTEEQELFINTFYTTYEKYFLVTDPVSYCRQLSTTSPQEMVEALLAITNKAGYILPKQRDLSLFAMDLVGACANNTMQAKADAFSTQFDVMYPY